MAAVAPKALYRPTTDWRVVLIRGEGLRGHKEEQIQKEQRRGDYLIQTHSNSSK